ncbi:MAG: hypothetical protein ACI84R_001511 [Candidatus Azotimanducaceae bacterium]
MKRTWLTTAAFLGFSAVAVTASPGICPGTYLGFQATLSGPVLGAFQGRKSTGQVTVTTSNCGNTLKVKPNDGPPMTLERSSGGAYIGAIKMQGRAITLSLSAASHQFVSGSMIISGGGLTLARSMDLLLQSATDVDDQNCPKAVTHLVSSENTIGVTMALEKFGAPAVDAGKSSEFISSADASNKTNGWVSISLDENRNAIKRKNLTLTRQQICNGKVFENRPKNILNFKIVQTDVDTYVFAQLIDLETGEILKQTAGLSEGVDIIAVASSAQKAMFEMNEDLTF